MAAQLKCFVHGHAFGVNYHGVEREADDNGARRLTRFPPEPEPTVVTRCTRCLKVFPISRYVGSWTVTLIPPASVSEPEEAKPTTPSLPTPAEDSQ